MPVNPVDVSQNGTDNVDKGRQKEESETEDPPESIDRGSEGVVNPEERREEERRQIGIWVINHIEQAAFAKWINKSLESDEETKMYLPLNEEGDDLYERCSDGVLLCKMINKAQPGTIFEKCINFPAAGQPLSDHQKLENCSLAINSAKSIGCNIVSTESDDILKDDIQKDEDFLDSFKKALPMLVWQVIKMDLLVDITIPQHSDLVLLLEPGEVLANPRLLSAEQLLMRWVNYHLAKSGSPRRIFNFKGDLDDFEVFTRLLKQVVCEEDNESSISLSMSQLSRRSAHSAYSYRSSCVLYTCEDLFTMLNMKDMLNVFITPESVQAHYSRLNLAFLANLFHHYPGRTEGEIRGRYTYKETFEEKSMFISFFVPWLTPLSRLYRIFSLNCCTVNNLTRSMQSPLSINSCLVAPTPERP